MEGLIIEERQLLLCHGIDDGDMLYRALGGTPLVHVFGDNGELRAYRNREAAELGMPPNVLATLLLRSFGVAAQGEVVHGTVLVCGVDENGAVADVPFWLIEYAKALVPEAHQLCELTTRSSN